MLVRHSGIALVAVLIAGCGGGGSDETAVSSSPTAPPVAATPDAGTVPGLTPPPVQAPAPGAVAAPSPVGSPAPVVGPAPSPAPSPSNVSGPVVLAALQAGVSADPQTANNPYTRYRKVTSSGNGYFYLGGNYQSFIISGGFPGASGTGLWDVVNVEPVINGGVIQSVKANGVTLDGAQLDLRNINPAVDAYAGTWSSGTSTASLVIQSVANQPDLMRICWNVGLPPPASVTGPLGFTPLVRAAPFKRLMCGVYSRTGNGADVGGYIADDVNGAVTIYSGTW